MICDISNKIEMLGYIILSLREVSEFVIIYEIVNDPFMKS